ncbi:MAG: HAD family hydrolase [Candidatus Eremiobacteraeota bacterium]|nr:HAD family hydrolase [Candidatus Eremiobacteraeota bacterium]MCW5872121.1 HAD family hydrolase [Candidatus Eremiobacteraeota bacterium]
MSILTLAFDADDTLWHNETLFAVTSEQIGALLAPYADSDNLHRRLVETERRNLRLFGYGVKGFTLSMIESAIEVSEGRVSAREIQAILEAGKKLLAHPIELLPQVRESLEGLAKKHNLMMITKGDLFHQESRLAMSGLGDLFSAVEIVSEKNAETYRKILRRYHLDAEDFVMVGNSVKSDILPVLEVGARAIYIPYEITWELEVAELGNPDPSRCRRCQSIAEVAGTVAEFFQTV